MRLAGQWLLVVIVSLLAGCRAKTTPSIDRSFIIPTGYYGFFAVPRSARLTAKTVTTIVPVSGKCAPVPAASFVLKRAKFTDGTAIPLLDELTNRDIERLGDNATFLEMYQLEVKEGFVWYVGTEKQKREFKNGVVIGLKRENRKKATR
jgi:hypothetical protein